MTRPSAVYKAKALKNLGNMLRVIGDIQQSKEVLEASLAIAQKWNSSQDKSRTLLSLGNTKLVIAIGTIALMLIN